MTPRQLAKYTIAHLDRFGPERPMVLRLAPEREWQRTPIGGKRPLLGNPRGSKLTYMDSPLGEVRQRTKAYDSVAFNPVEVLEFLRTSPTAREPA